MSPRLVGAPSDPGSRWGAKDNQRCDSEGDRGRVWDGDLALGTDRDTIYRSSNLLSWQLYLYRNESSLSKTE